MLMLDKFIAQRNAWLSLFDKTYAYPLTQSMVNDIARDIDSQLSPENLCMDGEASIGHIKSQKKFLVQAARELEEYSQRNGLDIPAFYEVL